MGHSIADLIARSGSHHHAPSVAEVGQKLPLEHQDDMAALAPVISGVPWRVLHHFSPWYVASLQRAPTSHARRADVLGRRNVGPINGKLNGTFSILMAHSPPETLLTRYKAQRIG